MALLLAILAGLLGLVLLVLLVPLRAWARGSVHAGTAAGEVRIDWGLGLLSVNAAAGHGAALRLAGIPVARLDGGRRARRRERKDRERANEPQPPKETAPSRLRPVLREREALLRMAARLLRALHPRLRASGTVGLGDPADMAGLAALLRTLEAVPGVELELELEWVEEALEMDVELGARVWVAELLVVAVSLLAVRAHRRALRAAFA